MHSCGHRRRCATAQEGKKVLLEDQAKYKENYHTAEAYVHSAKAEPASAPAAIVLITPIFNVVA
jgi:hypothetical protein